MKQGIFEMIFLAAFVRICDHFRSTRLSMTVRRSIRYFPRTSRAKKTRVGASYTFPHTLTLSDYPDIIRLDGSDRNATERYESQVAGLKRPIYAIVLDERIVSTCTSSRENETAGEAWVRTLPEFRRHGFARQVTAAWAHGLQQQGKIPFYSHSSDNLASRALARSLRLVQFVAGVSYF